MDKFQNAAVIHVSNYLENYANNSITAVREEVLKPVNPQIVLALPIYFLQSKCMYCLWLCVHCEKNPSDLAIFMNNRGTRRDVDIG